MGKVWLTHVLDRIADHKINRIDELLPWHYRAAWTVKSPNAGRLRLLFIRSKSGYNSLISELLGLIMKILGHGIDAVDTARFQTLFQESRDKHLNRYFTQRELKAAKEDSNAIFRLAARFAAKEAIMKSLQHGFGDGLGFTDIEIVFNENGAPTPLLHRKASELSATMGVQEWWISITYSGDIAIASAIACG